MALRNIPMEEYKKAVKMLADMQSNFVFRNSSPDHAAVVISNMISHAKDQVRLYDNALDGDIADRSPEVANSITTFLQSGKQLFVVLRNVDECESNIYSKLKELTAVYPEHLDIRKVSQDFQQGIVADYQKDINFAVGDHTSYRMEAVGNNDKEIHLRKAQCSFNSPVQATKLAELFDKYFETCQPAKF